ncbi:hypothetical protein EB118_00705 [bacterium]|nr:hypothetical protein [bacterium]
MFNFFKSKNINNTNKEHIDLEEEVIANITYFIKKDSSVVVDIAIKEYDEQSMNSLFQILDVLSEDKCYVETVNIIKENLIKVGQEKLVILLIQHIAKQAAKNENNKFINTYKDSISSQPCIQPSDMLR